MIRIDCEVKKSTRMLGVTQLKNIQFFRVEALQLIQTINSKRVNLLEHVSPSEKANSKQISFMRNN